MTDTTRIGAAIDVGSNSVHLLVAEIGEEETRVLLDESVLLGLGAMVDIEGKIPADGAEAAIDALTEYIAAAQDEGAEWITLLATEPLRRASNRTHFCEDVQEATGRPLHVLSHEEEAELTVLGVLDGEPPDEPLLVLDIGGGSSEIVLLEPGGDPVVGVMPVGSARLTAQHVEDDPPTAGEVAALRAEAHNLLSGMPAGHPQRGIIVGGSGTNLIRLTTDEADEETDDAGLIDKELAPASSRPRSIATTSNSWRPLTPACARVPSWPGSKPAKPGERTSEHSSRATDPRALIHLAIEAYCSSARIETPRRVIPPGRRRCGVGTRPGPPPPPPLPCPSRPARAGSPSRHRRSARS